jgi:hypothetical protein
MLPHTLGVLLSAASAIHDVQTPPLLLHGPVVQRLVERLADALVAAYEALGGDAIGDAEALCVQVVFDLNVSLDVLVGPTRPVAIAARAKAVEQRLLRSTPFFQQLSFCSILFFSSQSGRIDCSFVFLWFSFFFFLFAEW